MSSIDDNIDYKLSSSQKEIIEKNLDENGALPCIKAIKVARQIGVEEIQMSGITKSMGIKISDCELGVFGKLEFGEKEEIIYNTLIEKYDGNKKLECKILWDEAKNFSLRRVGSTVKNSDIEVTYCKLGCFVMRKGLKDGSKS